MSWPDDAGTQELLTAARSGAPGAIDRLLAAHRAALRRMVAARLSPRLARRVDASDVVQEALLVAARPAARVPGRARAAVPELAAPHRARPARRRGAPARGRGQEGARARGAGPRAMQGGSTLDLLARVADPARTPAASLLRRELQARFAQALETLDEDDREIVHLRHGEQLGNHEAAAVLGLSDAAAAMRWLRALRRLRGVLEAQDSERSRAR
jgi:RNA polymerase sigma-70 factor (ECF subfamily)